MRQRHCFANAYYLFLSVLYFVLGLIPFGSTFGICTAGAVLCVCDIWTLRCMVGLPLRQGPATFNV